MNDDKGKDGNASASEQDSVAALPLPPEVVSSHHRPSLVWLVPIIAAVIGVSMLVHAWLSAGPQITIRFDTATGLEAGKTTVKYKDVVIGNVAAITLAPDNSHVLVTVDLQKSAASFAREGSRFWVVRPRIGAGGVSGIDTVLSGAYIGVDSGASTQPAKAFVGLDTPPSVINGTPGRSFILQTEDLGSLEIGAPVFYRRIQVGQVAAYHLDSDGKKVTVQVFVNAPNDRFVTTNSRFWNASGVDLSLGADGLKLNTQSLATVIGGGIAFATPNGGSPASEQTPFVLAKDEQSAMADSDGDPIYLSMRFDQSLRGLTVDAPVEFMGTNIGRVTSVVVDYEADTLRFPVIVDAVIFPKRLTRVHEKLIIQTNNVEREEAEFMRAMVEKGLRAQPRPGNILTGQLYIAFDFIPNTPRVAFDMKARPFVMPTIQPNFTRVQEQILSVAAKLDKVPFDKIGQHLDDNLVELDKTLRLVNGTLLPEASSTLQDTRRSLGVVDSTLGTVGASLAPDAPLQQNLTETLKEVQRTARSLRTLTDMLGRHPESFIRGRAEDESAAGSPRQQVIKASSTSSTSQPERPAP